MSSLRYFVIGLKTYLRMSFKRIYDCFKSDTISVTKYKLVYEVMPSLSHTHTEREMRTGYAGEVAL